MQQLILLLIALLGGMSPASRIVARQHQLSVL